MWRAHCGENCRWLGKLKFRIINFTELGSNFIHDPKCRLIFVLPPVRTCPWSLKSRDRVASIRRNHGTLIGEMLQHPWWWSVRVLCSLSGWWSSVVWLVGAKSTPTTLDDARGAEDNQTCYECQASLWLRGSASILFQRPASLFYRSHFLPLSLSLSLSLSVSLSVSLTRYLRASSFR